MTFPVKTHGSVRLSVNALNSRHDFTVAEGFDIAPRKTCRRIPMVKRHIKSQFCGTVHCGERGDFRHGDFRLAVKLKLHRDPAAGFLFGDHGFGGAVEAPSRRYEERIFGQNRGTGSAVFLETHGERSIAARPESAVMRGCVQGFRLDLLSADQIKKIPAVFRQFPMDRMTRCAVRERDGKEFQPSGGVGRDSPVVDFPVSGKQTVFDDELFGIQAVFLRIIQRTDCRKIVVAQQVGTSTDRREIFCKRFTPGNGNGFDREIFSLGCYFFFCGAAAFLVPL